MNRVSILRICCEYQVFLPVIYGSDSIDDISNLFGGAAAAHLLQPFPSVPHFVAYSAARPMFVEAKTDS
jgi:hypothetical protein